MKLNNLSSEEMLENALAEISEKISEMENMCDSDLQQIVSENEARADDLLEEILDNITIWTVKATDVADLDKCDFSGFLDEIIIQYFDLASDVISATKWPICDSLSFKYLLHIKLMNDRAYLMSNDKDHFMGIEVYEQATSSLYSLAELCLVAYMIALDKEDIIEQFKLKNGEN